MAGTSATSGSTTVVEPSAYLKTKLDAALESSQRFMNLGLYTAALDECYEAIGWLPTYVPIHVRIGEIYAASGRIDDAIEEYSAIASLFMARDDPEGAIEVYKKIVGLDADDAGPVRRLAGALLQMYRSGEARRAIEENGIVDHSFCLTVADRLMGDQNWPDAICLLEAMEQRGLVDDTTYMKLAEAHFRQGNPGGAISAFDRLAGVLSAKGNRRKAFDLYRVIKELAPELALPYLRLGDACAADGMAGAAAAEYRALAELQIKQGKTVDAIKTLKRVVQLEPDNAPARARLQLMEGNLGAQDKEK
ncbi:MAG: tetratricopeptide repeat protein [Dehalococcoidia bacterium]|nr:tetratricopeptide repeat protein [Dehalococcoidia bacterium]